MMRYVLYCVGYDCGFLFRLLQIASVLESLKPSVLLTLVSYHYHLNVYMCMHVNCTLLCVAWLEHRQWSYVL